MKINILAILLLLIGFYSKAQISVKEPPIVTEMVNNFVTNNQTITNLKGYRIQIFETRNRLEMKNLERRFQYDFPNIATSFIHDRPYYKLRVGAFETKLEGQRLLNIIREDYSSAYLVIDYKIKPEEFVY